MYENMTFDAIMNRMLERIPTGIDKREGSIIYDALAPAAAEMSIMYLEMDLLLNETFADTASREYLIHRCAERGILPEEATNAVLQGVFTPTTIDLLGQRFNCESLNFVCSEQIEPGRYKLKCETAGEVGNITVGTLIPINYIEGLESAQIMGILIPGEDEEDTEVLRSRYFASLDTQPFGGNVTDYKMITNALNGVGGCKVYPVWNGGGTVKVMIIDAQYKPPSQTLIDSVQSALDPVDEVGKGKGFAPIGHIVTVVGAEALPINIEMTVTYRTGYGYASAAASINEVIDNYFAEISKEWESSESSIVRVSQIESRILELDDVLDVQNTLLNGSDRNLVLGDDELPTRGTFNGA
ncbi:baseplate J/gp47 family protein [Cuneatibacter sp. NSJ-177]|uniref:baseplate J/gp47 family protein n=1 Tax=Cuneatibacter sp. NSJ-177 TaxID=2931401 RepID=UPI001FD3D16C|nr:baseplate J/gp47 family protein [Cuneatibacter sp. NSJ-177]